MKQSTGIKNTVGYKTLRMYLRLLITLIISSFAGQCMAQTYPIPEKRSELLFYIQRNLNTNTIVYDANFDKDGKLNSKQAVKVYWIRYDEEGQTMKLRSMEKMFAYGARSNKIKGKDNEYKLKLVAYKDKEFTLIQTEPNKVEVFTMINNSYCKLDHLFINADNSKFWPVVKYVEIFGFNIESNKAVSEIIIINE